MNLKKIPPKPGCYIFKDNKENIIYIGKAKNLKKRVGSYFLSRENSAKNQKLIENIDSVDYIITKNEIEALILENTLIKKNKPKYNVELKNNDKYAYIKITSEKIPKLIVSRGKRDQTGIYYGPFVSAQKRDYIIKTLNKVFKLRTCKTLGKKPCLRFYMNQCNGVCFGKEPVSEYLKRIEEVKLILSGKTQEIISNLEKQMTNFSKENNFESALILRDRINSIKYLDTKQMMERNKKNNEDIINFSFKDTHAYFLVFNINKGNLINKQEFTLDREQFKTLDDFLINYYSNTELPKELIVPKDLKLNTIEYLNKISKQKLIINIPKKGDKKKLLELISENIRYLFFNKLDVVENLKIKLNLKKTPLVIECFDISHLSGTNIVASMVQFENGKPNKKEYRRYKIKTVKNNNDYESIKEVVYRRYKRLLIENKSLPDLIIIDGGKGQLSSAISSLKELGIDVNSQDVISIAKREEEIFKPNNLIPIKLNKKDSSLHLLQFIRDESHRFAITYQKKLRLKKMWRKNMENKFKLISKFKPGGDQPKAIKKLSDGLLKKNLKIEKNFQTLLGVTGSGKTFAVSGVIEKYQKPTLVIAHNKTLAAQLYNEFKEFFPENKVEYFVSYYDFYQPESYLPTRDLYIEKNTKVNAEIEKLRLRATAALTSRNDVIIVASVSCIYGLGNPENYKELSVPIFVNQKIERKKLLDKFLDIQYQRNDNNLEPGNFRVRGQTIDIVPAYYDNIIRIEMFGDEIERILEINKLDNTVVAKMKSIKIHPAKHFVIKDEQKEKALIGIRKELEERLPELEPIAQQRLSQRVRYDLEMIKETGYCNGIENYSRFFDERREGQRPFCLIDYFPKDFLLIIDESHQTIPQINGMYAGDYSRKRNLVDYGFRLPSALDNRPLKFKEFEKNFMKNVIFVSATPSDYEISNSNKIVEQIIRPTGLIDPQVEIRSTKSQITDLIKEILATIKKKERILVTTLTKKLAEEVSEFLAEKGIRTRYLHSEINTLERTEIIRELRLGKFDCLVGINLLREGIDIPEVSLIGILDADKEGFLRDKKSLIQIIGRAARNSNSKVILYADIITKSIKGAIDETKRRRNIQIAYNKKHNIIPKTIIKEIPTKEREIKDVKSIPKAEVPKTIKILEKEMKKASEDLDFEKAIFLRDKINALKERSKL